MKKIYNSKTGSYLVETETGMLGKLPEKCKTCNNIKKVAKGCNLEECDLEEYENAKANRR